MTIQRSVGSLLDPTKTHRALPHRDPSATGSWFFSERRNTYPRILSLVGPLGTGYKWGMAFKVKRNEVNHTPAWYHEHCRGEDAAPSVRAMLIADMNLIGAEIDSTIRDCERIHIYEDTWDEVLADDPRRGSLPHGMLEAIEREEPKEFTPPGCYQHPPFTSLGEIMDDADLDEDTVREYLKWRVRQRTTAERRAKKEAELLKPKPHKWFTSEADTTEPNANDV